MRLQIGHHQIHTIHLNFHLLLLPQLLLMQKFQYSQSQSKAYYTLPLPQILLLLYFHQNSYYLLHLRLLPLLLQLNKMN